MPSISVVVCGVPFSGKRTIVNRLAESTKYREITSDLDEYEPNVRFNITLNGKIFHFVARSGPYLYPHKLIPRILSKVQAVIYIFEPCFPDGRSLQDNNEYQQEYFDYYVQYAKETGVLWTEVPWIAVLNKMDLASVPPPTVSYLPDVVRDRIIHCVAVQDIGISELRERLIELF